MSNYPNAEREIHNYFKEIWDKWYSKYHDLKPAKLIIEELPDHPENVDSLYDIVNDIIYVRLGYFDLEELDQKIRNSSSFSCISPKIWPRWKGELIHEMLHEYQYKVIKGKLTKNGETLFEKNKNKFPGGGHEVDYYTAVYDLASTFGLTQEELIINL